MAINERAQKADVIGVWREERAHATLCRDCLPSRVTQTFFKTPPASFLSHQYVFQNIGVDGTSIECGRSQDANLIASLSMIDFGQNLRILHRARLTMILLIR